MKAAEAHPGLDKAVRQAMQRAEADKADSPQELRINAEAVRTQYHRELLAELQALVRRGGGGFRDRRDMRRGAAILRKLKKYGILADVQPQDLPATEEVR